MRYKVGDIVFAILMHSVIRCVVSVVDNGFFGDSATDRNGELIGTFYPTLTEALTVLQVTRARYERRSSDV